MVSVSVVITTFKRPDHLKKAIQTVKEQTHKDVELIVVDGTQLEDKSIQHSRNYGCKKATGDYIAMLDDDDLWKKDKLEKQLQEFKNPNVGLVSTGELRNPTYTDLLKSFCIGNTSSIMVPRCVMEEIGFWDESLRGMHEYDIALKIAKKGYQIVNISKPLVLRGGQGLECSWYHKIAENFDLWHKYGRDFSFRIFVYNSLRFVVLTSFYLMGYVFGGSILYVTNKFKGLKADV